MKKLIPLSLMCLLLLGVGTTQAQTAEQPVGFKVFFGTQAYNGDLGNEDGEFANSDFTYGLGLGFYLNELFDLSLDAQVMTLDRVNGPNDTVSSQRNTSFTTDNVNVNLMLRLKPFVDSRLNPYIAAGVGGNYLQYGFTTGTLQNEDDFIFSIPFGIGVNYEMREDLSLNVQAIYNRTFDDGIDGYSDDFNNAIDDIDHDDFFTLTIGAVYNFGGEDQVSYEERLLKQSLENMKAAENSSDEASATLKQAQQLNDETLAALDELREAIDQMPEESNEIRGKLVRVVNNVQFEYDKSEIIEPAYDELNSLAGILKEYKALNIDIAARADKRGSDSYNKSLSMRRAQAVKDYLVNQGVSSSRISTSALGENDPLMSGNSQTAYAQNRSVQVTLSYTGGSMNDDEMMEDNGGN